ncbi:MAG TPA: amino acid adenylation domain-containing protein, partial [Longimicrobiaceae bacterium]|nr:amino acid adenylation domain-containing protein [Longimicrobiaceae bacterium]
HRLVWTHHHLLLDGWSVGLVYRDVLALYAAQLQGRTAELARPRPYRDYIAWLARQDLARAEAFWRAELAGFRAPTPLGIERAAAVQDAAQAEAEEAAGDGSCKVVLGEERTGAVQALAKRLLVTPATVVQGAWALLLSRYSGEEDVLFGATVSGRPAELDGVEEMVGNFINTLPLRVRIEGGATVEALLKAVQQKQGALREYEYSPLVQVQGWSEVERGRPLFESFLSFQNFPFQASAADASAGGLAAREAWGVEEANYPIALAAELRGSELVLDVSYARARFEDGAMQRMLEQLGAVLDAFAADPGRRLAEVRLLEEQERAAVLALGRGAAEPFEAEATVHEVIARRAERWAQAEACVCGAERLSYGALLERAERLAGVLRGLGVGPEVPVALFLERSNPLAVSLLAVLRAGGFYVPLDPAYPAERLGFLLRDSGAALVLSHSGLAASLPAHSARVLCLDRLDESGLDAAASAACPDSGVLPENLAYTLYTSGSTGQPKAAMVSHRSLLCYAEAMRKQLELGPDDRILQFASPSFDVMVEELFPAWLSGAAVVFPEAELLGAPEELARVVEAQGVTGFELPTAFWHEWVRGLAEEGRGLPGCVRFVIVGGERVLPERLRQWAALRTPLVHVFGLTETSVTSTVLRLQAGEDASARWANLPVGRPLPNVELYVLDAAREPVPPGVAGELYVGGAGVGRGYRGRPELTAERYVPHPHTREAGGRLYRTGDRVRWLEDGELEFLGRMDQQVKVRGFRIEPAEVEAVLVEHPGVAEAVVVAHAEEPGRSRLVGYFVAAGPAPTAAELRAFAAERLPEHMVPGTFVRLEALPLTANGKLDRRALPAPDSAGEERGYEAPRTATEQALASVWAEVLRVERVGVHDNFFELGGDSILSIQIVSRARRAGIRLTPRQLFEHPTVAGLAGAAGAGAAGAGAPGEASAEQGAATGEVPLTPIQHWFFAEDIPERSHWNMPLLLEPVERLDPGALAAALAHLLAHHDALRLRFARAGEGWRQWYAPAEGGAPFEQLDLAHVPDAELEAALQAEGTRVQAGLALENGPVFRAALFDLGSRGQRLLVAVHHLVVDGVSWRVLLEDLETAYRQAARGERLALPPKTTSLRKWAERLAEHTRRGGFDAEMGYWTREARLHAPALPTDRAGDDTEASAATVEVALTAAETRALLQEVPAAYRTQVNDALLAALARAFQAWTGSGLLAVELEGHGHEDLFPDVDLSRTVGWFTTLYPVLLDVRGADGVRGALRAVREELRAVPGRGIGYGALRWLGGEETRARLAALPPAEVRFEYLGRFDGSVSGDTLFRLAGEPAGRSSSASAPRSHRLEVSAGVLEDRLRVSWGYSRGVHDGATVRRLAERYLDELRALVASCRDAEAGGLTPSDFPLAGLDQDALDRLLGNERGIEDVYPLTPMQEGMLFESQVAPGAGVYVAQRSFVVRGPLDATALRAAWEGVLERHTALRTAFTPVPDGRTLQVVRARVPLPLHPEDWRALPAAEQEEALEAYLREDRARGFETSRAPLMRLALFRTGEAEHVLVWSFHMMLLDGWSVPLVFRDLMDGYEAVRTGRPAGLARAAPFREYVAWLARQDLARAERHWRDALAGFRAPTRLEVEPAHPGGPGGTAAVELRLSTEGSAALAAATRRHAVTASTLVQGAWALLLSRYSGEEDVVFGATVSGRPPEVEGVEEMVGLFINTLPVRVRVEPGTEVLPWLRALQAQNLALREYEYTPLVQLQEWSEVPRGTPLFESILVSANYPIAAGPESGEQQVEVERHAVREQGSFPLTVAAELQSEVALRVEYDRGRFHRGAVERLLERLGMALEEIAADPERRLSEVPLMRAAERARVLEGWNAPEGRSPARCVHELFGEQAARTPGAPAVVFRGETLTYAGLD